MNTLLVGSNIFIILNFLIIIILLWARRNNSLTNGILGFYILLHVLVLSLNLLVYCNYLDPYFYFLCSIPACLIGPMAYLYCKLLLSGEKRKVPSKMRWHFIPALCVPLLLVLVKNVNLSGDQNIYSFLLRGSGEFPDLLKLCITCHIAGYYFYTWYHIKKQEGQIRTFSNYEILKINWAKNFIYSVTLFISTFSFLHLLSILYMNTWKTGSSFVSPLICLFLYFFILRKAVVHSAVFNEVKENKTIYPVLDETILNTLEIKLQQILKDHKPYLDKELNLKKLSLLVDVSHKHLSQLINQKYEKNFNDFINSYRVEESRKMLQDPGLNNLKLEAIAEAAGFNSRASFFSIFKKFTGHTPASYRKEHCITMK